MLSGMTVHRPTRLWIGFDITTANRFFTISGGLNPSSKLTVTRLACGGCCWIGILGGGGGTARPPVRAASCGDFR